MLKMPIEFVCLLTHNTEQHGFSVATQVTILRWRLGHVRKLLKSISDFHSKIWCNFFILTFKARQDVVNHPLQDSLMHSVSSSNSESACVSWQHPQAQLPSQHSYSFAVSCPSYTLQNYYRSASFGTIYGIFTRYSKLLFANLSSPCICHFRCKPFRNSLTELITPPLVLHNFVHISY